ncbi:hypothetical protein DY000_02022014 [Brassica cretica]|uniref:Uncharacterized protein n=1 Tax=Brassica cretica TaxID=69181 RepID=A0ABQ7DYN1_BRACR|nr:hypothetical protein DY000_02022014 [Brassica cretica]
MESGEFVVISDYDVRTKREKRWSLLSQLLADPILADALRNPTLSYVVTLVSLEKGSAMRLSIVKLDGSSLGNVLLYWHFVEHLIVMNTDRICSICDEEGSGKTLEEEEASSLSFTPQDLLDSSGSVVEGGRGEATEPSNSSEPLMIGGTQARLHHRRKLCPLEKGTD